MRAQESLILNYSTYIFKCMTVVSSEVDIDRLDRTTYRLVKSIMDVNERLRLSPPSRQFLHI